MTTFRKVVLLIVSFGSCVSSSSHNYRPLRYTVPQPLIQALTPRGLKVSIPHTDGIQLFAFHGNINKPLVGIEAGQLSRDVLETEGDYWVFRDSTVHVQVGDKIYYWLYVVRDNLGYRYDHGIHEVKDLVEAEQPSPTPSVEYDSPNICENVMLNLTQKLLHSQQEIESLRETNDILEDMVQKHLDTATTLGLDGLMAKDEDDLVLLIHAIIKEKLHLPFTIRNVTRKKNGLVKFEVGSLREKLEVVKAAKRKLSASRYTITY